MARSPKSSPQRKPRHHELAPATGLAARLERAADSGRLHHIEEAPRRRARQEPVIPPPGDEDPDEMPMPVPEDETDWEAELPPPTEEDLKAALSQSLQAVEVADEHLDTLWDWVRKDEDKGQRFLGIAPKSSTQLRERMSLFGEHVYALIDGTPEGEAHVGFAGFNPVTPTHAFAHLYLSQEARGRARQLVPQLLEMAANQYPGRVFVISTTDPAHMRLYRSIGFSVDFMLRWTPPTPPVTTTEE